MLRIVQIDQFLINRIASVASTLGSDNGPSGKMTYHVRRKICEHFDLNLLKMRQMFSALLARQFPSRDIWYVPLRVIEFLWYWLDTRER